MNFVVNKPVTWIGYGLDGQANVTINENTTLTSLPVGLHTLTVYAEDEFGNIGASETITFTVAQETSPTEPEPFPTFPVVAVAAVSAVAVCAGLIVYFKKHHH